MGFVRDYIASFFLDAAEWARGRSWILRILLLGIIAYIFLRHIFSAEYQSIFKGLNLGIHELGHFVFGIFGQFIGVAGGTIAQLLAPVIGMVMFVFQRDYYGIAIAFGWLGTNFYDVAAYCGDARAMELPLVSPFGMGGCVHDWNFLLGETGLLSADKTISFLFRTCGFFSFLFCLIFGAWLIYLMIKTHGEFKETAES